MTPQLEGLAKQLEQLLERIDEAATKMEIVERVRRLQAAGYDAAICGICRGTALDCSSPASSQREPCPHCHEGLVLVVRR